LIGVDDVMYSAPDATAAEGGAPSADGGEERAASEAGGEDGPGGDSTQGTADSAPDAGTDAYCSVFDAAGFCYGHGPCGQLSVCADASGGRVCIDQTEVTIDDYNAFYLALANASVITDIASKLPVDCKNRLLNQSAANPTSPLPWAGGCQPIVEVSWCQAHAYCLWRGKHMCGRIGDGGRISADNNDHRDAAVSEWTFACTNGGTQSFSYGNLSESCACNTSECNADAAVAVGSSPKCFGALDGAADLIGNVNEWENAVHDGGVINYYAQRSPGYLQQISTDNCAWVSGADDTYLDKGNREIGIRCCGE
jgi:hypothetical protein